MIYNKNICRLTAFIAVFFFPFLCYARNLPKQSLVPGGVAVVKIASSSSSRPDVSFHNHKVMVVRRGRNWDAIIGIPLTTKPGINYLMVKHYGKQSRLQLYIHSKSYPAQHIHLRKNKRKYVSPPKSFYQRLKRERAIMNAAFSHWSEPRKINLHFIWPVKGRISGVFGLRRFYNGVEKGRHKGVDIAASRGRNVRAPAAATVVNTGHYYFTGKTVLLDHGQGLVSVCAHLNKILAKPGEHVRQGQVIGKIGSTGRSTGPHLHWGVSLNQARVNPLLFIKG